MNKYYFEIRIGKQISNGVICALNIDHARAVLNIMSNGNPYTFTDLKSSIIIGF